MRWSGAMGDPVYSVYVYWGQVMFGETGVLLASIMESLMPIISVLLIWFLSKKKPSIYTLSFIGLAFIGVLLVVTNGELSFLLTMHKQLFPLIILFLGVVGWVVYTMGGDQYPNWSILRFSTLTLIYGTGTTTILVLLTTAFGWIEAPTMAAIYAVRCDMLIMVIFSGLIALLGWNEAVRILNLIISLLFICFVLVTTLIIGFFQDYNLSIYDVVGMIFIVTALLLNNIYQRLKLRKEDERQRLYDEQVQHSAV